MMYFYYIVIQGRRYIYIYKEVSIVNLDIQRPKSMYFERILSFLDFAIIWSKDAKTSV